MEAVLTPVHEIEPTFDGAGSRVGSLEWTWEMTNSEGTRLGRFGSATTAPLGMATATLRADHGYPPGHWIPEADGYRYVPDIKE